MRFKEIFRVISSAIVLIAFILFGLYGIGQGAERVTVTTTKIGSVFETQIDWITAADGSLTETTITPGISGMILLAITDPGSPAPTDNYTVLIKDENNIDLFGSSLQNRDTVNSEESEPSIAYRYLTGPLTFDITNNSVDSAQGKVLLYILTK